MLSNEQIERYSRQIILPQVGGRGQERLLGAALAIVGADRIGCTAALYLAGAGVGKLTIIDNRCTECGNGKAARQSNYAREAAAYLNGLNPDCRITALAAPVNAALAAAVTRDNDILVDAAGSHETSVVLNRVCLTERKPLVWGAVAGVLGAIGVFAGPWPHASCYECYRDAPSAPPMTAGDAGPVGRMAADFIGALQAAEVIKIILGMETDVVGSILLCDAEDMTVRELTPARNPHCHSCGAPSLS